MRKYIVAGLLSISFTANAQQSEQDSLKFKNIEQVTMLEINPNIYQEQANILAYVNWKN